MGTVAGLRTRRYHGLLVVASAGPSARMLGLAALDPVLVVGDARHRLADDEWASGVVDPRGYELLVSFELDRGVPRWRWQVGGVVLEREVAMAHGRSAVGVVHRLVRAAAGTARADAALHVEKRPRRAAAAGAPDVEETADGFVFEDAYRVAGAGWRPGGAWYRGVRAREEAARGLDDVEDLWAAGAFSVELDVGDAHEVTAAAAPFAGRVPSATAIVRAAKRRAGALCRTANAKGEPEKQLVLAADRFVIEHDGPTAVAGYPWFGEWSRDLMTSYEGLFLATGRHEEGREALRRAAATRLGRDAREHGRHRDTRVQHGRRHALVRARSRAARRGHRRRRPRRRARPGARGDRAAATSKARASASASMPTACCGRASEGWALTWMDARIDGAPVTPRIGKPVEVNALWIEALAIAGRLGRTDRWRTGARARAGVVRATAS